MKVFVIALALIASPLLPDRAFADDNNFPNVQKTREWCQDKNNAWGHGYCTGLVSGMMMMMGLNGTAGTSPASMCASPSTPFGAGVQAFLNWADKHPEHWGDPGAAGVMLALMDLWPCKGKNAPGT
jgi:hypothetical protein